MILRIATLLSIFLLMCIFNTYSQENAFKERGTSSLPGAFHNIKDNKAKLVFLKKIISDSIDENQLTHVLEWSEIGLHNAELLGVDSLKGSFLLYIGKAYTYFYSKFDSAIFFYKKALPYFPQKLSTEHIVLVREIMENYSELGNNDSTHAYLALTESIMEDLPDTSRKKISLAQNVASLYSDFSMFKIAIKYYKFAINGSMHNKNYRSLGLALANLGLVYDELEDDKNAIKFSKEALTYLADVRMSWAMTASNVAAYYYNLSEFDSARLYLKKSDSVATIINYPYTIRANANILAGILIAEKQYPAAENILNKNLLFFEQHEEPINIIKTLFYLSNSDTSKHNYLSATKYLTRALNMSRKIDNKVLEAMALQNLTNTASAMGDYKKALYYHTEFAAAKDSISKEKTKTELSELEIDYKMQQKESQIELLKKDNNIQLLQLQNNRRTMIFYSILFVVALSLTGILFRQRNLRNKIQAQKIKAELETKILMSQMNPHFIFNCLNSIENFMMQNDKRAAIDYLNKFARLIRIILDSSRSELVPFLKDMEAIRLYVELEQLRYNNKFPFKTIIDPALPGDDYRVPPLLIQPYVENAILHGLSQSERDDLELLVTVNLEGDYIVYGICDNGIGRKKSSEYKQRNRPEHKSIGMQLTQERVSIFNETVKADGKITITDLFDEYNEPCGTHVRLTIKAV